MKRGHHFSVYNTLNHRTVDFYIKFCNVLKYTDCFSSFFNISVLLWILGALFFLGMLIKLLGSIKNRMHENKSKTSFIYDRLIVENKNIYLFFHSNSSRAFPHYRLFCIG